MTNTCLAIYQRFPHSTTVGGGANKSVELAAEKERGMVPVKAMVVSQRLSQGASQLRRNLCGSRDTLAELEGKPG